MTPEFLGRNHPNKTMELFQLLLRNDRRMFDHFGGINLKQKKQQRQRKKSSTDLYTSPNFSSQKKNLKGHDNTWKDDRFPFYRGGPFFSRFGLVFWHFLDSSRENLDASMVDKSLIFRSPSDWEPKLVPKFFSPGSRLSADYLKLIETPNFGWKKMHHTTKYGRLGFQAYLLKQKVFFTFMWWNLESTREGTYSHDTKSPFS